MPLRGKVAAIIGDDSVVINLGSSQGVKPGMRFQAIVESGPIRDPDDPNKILGEIRYEITKLKATNVLEKMSICTVPRSAALQNLVLPATIFAQGDSKVDPRAPRLIDGLQFVVSVGTVVVEMPDEPGAGESTAPKTSTSAD